MTYPDSRHMHTHAMRILSSIVICEVSKSTLHCSVTQAHLPHRALESLGLPLSYRYGMTMASTEYNSDYINSLMQKRCNSIANVLELRPFCIKPSIWTRSSFSGGHQVVHISLHTHGTFYLFVCAVNVCTLLENKISIWTHKRHSIPSCFCEYLGENDHVVKSFYCSTSLTNAVKYYVLVSWPQCWLMT